MEMKCGEAIWNSNLFILHFFQRQDASREKKVLSVNIQLVIDSLRNDYTH